MNAIRRNLQATIERDLAKKFVFVSGPRQVGKTTLARSIIDARKGTYLLYDDDEDRRAILRKSYVSDEWVCLDEFHKFPRWKGHVKGIFDKHHKSLHLLLTGSARLDVFQKSGDSLFGRYYLHHLHPLTLGELASAKLPVEAKLSETRPAPSLEYFSKRLNVPAIQVISTEGFSRQMGNVLVVSANRWLGRMP